MESLERLHEIDDAWNEPSAGERLRAMRRAGQALRERILASGRVAGVRTLDLMPFIYPMAYALGGVAASRLPYVMLRNAALVVQYHDRAGDRRTLLFNPTDYEKSLATPYFVELRRKLTPPIFDGMAKAMRRPKADEQLAGLGLSPADVDFIAFDHLHVQDVREMLGAGGAAARYPRAKLLVSRAELAILGPGGRGPLHPLQARWYVKDGVRDVPADRIVAIDGDVLLGGGVALVRTPGHTAGNASLVLSTDHGVWAVSENGVGCDAYAPNASRIGGLARHARQKDVEVILNANTLEGTNEQYTSMVLEKTLVDRVPDAPEFFQHFSSSQLVSSVLAPGLGPTYRHRGITSGELRAPARTAAPAHAHAP